MGPSVWCRYKGRMAPINRAMNRLIRHHTEYGQSGRRVQMKKPRARRGQASTGREVIASRVA